MEALLRLLSSMNHLLVQAVTTPHRGPYHFQGPSSTFTCADEKGVHQTKCVSVCLSLDKRKGETGKQVTLFSESLGK